MKCLHTKIVSEYDQEIPQSQTADNPMAPRGRAAKTEVLTFNCQIWCLNAIMLI